MMIHPGRSLYTQCSPDWSWTVNSLPDYDLWFISSGQGTLELNGKKIILEQSMAILIEPGSRTQARQNPENLLNVYAAHFMPEIMDSFLDLGNRPIKIGNRNFFRELFIRHLGTDNSDESGDPLWLEALLRELRYWNCHHEQNNNSYLYQKLDDISRRIGKDPGFDWSIDQLADEAALCKDHFIRSFREIKGITPGQFIIESRLTRAQQLLTESDYTIYRIAELCGFDSSQWFCRLFRQKKGISPGAYRKNSSSRVLIR